MTDKPITFEDQVKVSRRLQRIARLIDKELKAAGVLGMTWSLYTWGGGRAQYVSNAKRDDVKIAMQEALARWNEPQDLPPHTGFN